MAKIIKVKNNKVTTDTWAGQAIAAGAEYTLGVSEYPTWTGNTKVLTDAATGDLGVSDGAAYFTTASLRIDWLKGEPAIKLSASGNQIVEHAPPTGPAGQKAISLVTPNLSDRTTWYQKSAQVIGATLTDSGDGLTFTSANPWWVDINNKKLTYTYKQIPKRDGSMGKHADWAASVSVNGVVQTTGFTIDYATGAVTFLSSQSGSVVTATYWHTNGVTNPSEWLFVPANGKIYTINCVELQYAMDIAPTMDTILFEIWAGANLATYGSFPDYLFDAGYGQFRASYRSVWDIINVTNNQNSTIIPKHGPMQNDVFIAPFNYTQAVRMDSAQGALLRMCLLNNTPVDAEHTSACFYLTIS